MKGKRFDVKQFLGKNSVPVLFIIICAVLIPVSGLPVSYILNEAMTRLGRNAFLILSLLIPIMAGMGLNFAMTLGAMAGEIALILVADWQIWGIPGLVLAAILSIRILQATLTGTNERSFRCRRAWLALAFGVPLLAFYCTFGDILSNLIWCGMMIWLSFCAIRGLAYAKTQMGAARNMRWFHIGVLCFAFAEYLLWTAGCFWPDTSPTSPTFWCDMLLTFAILGLLPATRRAVEA